MYIFTKNHSYLWKYTVLHLGEIAELVILNTLLALVLKYHNLVITLIVLRLSAKIDKPQSEYPIPSPRHSPTFLHAEREKERNKTRRSKSTLNRMTTSGHSFTGRTDVNYIAEGEGCTRGRRAPEKGWYRNRCVHLPRGGVCTLRGDW